MSIHKDTKSVRIDFEIDEFTKSKEKRFMKCMRMVISTGL